MPNRSRVGRHLTVLATTTVLFLVPFAPSASGTTTSDGVQILELPDHEEHQGFVPRSDRPPVVAKPVAPVQTSALDPWTLAFVPVLGAAAGAVAGLRRRWAVTPAMKAGA